MNLGLTVDPLGTIYACGTAQTDGPGQRGLVFGSSDSGTSWTGPLSDFGLAGFHISFGGGIVSDAAGNLYVAGLLIDDNFTNPDHWVVRRSIDGGATWATVDDFDRGGTWSDGEEPGGIAVDAEGDVYVAGTSYSSGTFVWTVRKGVGGTSFSTLDAMSVGFARAMSSHPTLGLFAAGSKAVTIRNKTEWVWTVRRSINGGATWSNVDSFQLASSYAASGLEIGADAVGNLYGAGRAYDRNGSHWLVRKSANGGSSWNTVDNFQPSGSNAEARAFAANSNGDLFVTGTSGGHWIVRKNPGGTGTWSTIDDYQYDAGASTEPHAMVADALGNLFVGGFGWGPSGGHWLIKKY